jgi:colanic acid biosynthesis glycosyl transferase WcaI
MESKRILFIGENYFPELIGIGKYNGEMVDLLARKGHECTVITSYPYYPQWKVQKPYAKNPIWYKKEVKKVEGGESGGDIRIYRCPQYLPSRPTGKGRMLLDLTFFLSAFFVVIRLLFGRKYDLVIVVAPGFLLGLLGIVYKKLRKAKFLYHIQDLQIDMARDLNMIRSAGMIRMLVKLEKYILTNADIVSSISPGMIRKIRGKCAKEVVYFPNWVDTSVYFPLAQKEALKREFNFSPSDKIVLYSGAIGEKQGLENIIHIAKLLEHFSNLKFVICGSGPYRENLFQLQRSLSLKNVVFLQLQPTDKLNHFLNMADIHLVLQKSGASDLVMPSKLTTILSVGGVSIVTASKNSSLYEVVQSNHMGVLVEPENRSELLTAIEQTLNNDNAQINKNARAYAEKFLSIQNVITRYTEFAFLLLVSVMAGCSTTKSLNTDYLYFQRGLDSLAAIQHIPTPLKVNDLLTIQVNSNSMNQEQVAVFYLPGNTVTGTGIVRREYQIGSDGGIYLPLLGEVKAAGLTTDQLQSYITKRLSNYIKDPEVVVRFADFKVNVLGEVRLPGTHKFEQDRVTILDAIGSAGDLTDYGKRENIVVIREEMHGRKVYSIDLRSGSLFQSPAYLLQPDDVVYVSSTAKKLRMLNNNPDSQKSWGIAFGLTSAMATVATLLITVLRK